MESTLKTHQQAVSQFTYPQLEKWQQVHIIPFKKVTKFGLTDLLSREGV